MRTATTTSASTSIELPEDLTLAAPIAGHVRLTRTNRGILADADLRTSLAMECVRCLRPAVIPLDLRLTEEYLPSIDLLEWRPRRRPRTSRTPHA